MTKVIIQIPCLNEEKTLAYTLSKLPRELPGVDKVEWLIINDGSTDNTVQVAREAGVDHVLNFNLNKGLAKAFMGGVEECLRLGADIIVNTDADNQYCADDIHKLVTPIIEKKADYVIGERPIMSTPHFSIVKKLLQKLGSFMVKTVSSTEIKDAPSGFRAISRDVAMRLNVFNEYTYTIETIIQAGTSDMTIMSVPIRTNEDLRPSRLVRSIPDYIRHSIITMIRIFNAYKPMKFFMKLAVLPLLVGIGLSVRWVIFFMGQPASHIPSLILAALCLIIGVQLMIFGLMADIISVNRKILEDIQVKTRELTYKQEKSK